ELCDQWILSRFHQTVQRVSAYIDKFAMGEAAKELYDFTWRDFCDWYIELVKSRLFNQENPSRRVAQQTLAYVLDGILKLLHPFMPHITEEVWQTLNRAEPDDEWVLAIAAYPKPNPDLISDELEQQFDLLIDTIRTIRNLRAEAGVKPNLKVAAILQSENPQERHTLTQGEIYIKDLAKVETLTITDTAPEQKMFAGVTGTVQVLMPLAGLVDVDALKAKLERDLKKVEGEIKSLQGRLNNPKFVEQAPADVVLGAREALAEAEKQAEILRSRLAQL
ncbi:MAG: class I tRNA ligase family protein, partial [Leptolyngbyaceae bacterium]|nr:class I tRNA ligase family protein [Leptolyngbyaceae bacterium]